MVSLLMIFSAPSILRVPVRSPPGVLIAVWRLILLALLVTVVLMRQVKLRYVLIALVLLVGVWIYQSKLY